MFRTDQVGNCGIYRFMLLMLIRIAATAIIWQRKPSIITMKTYIYRTGSSSEEAKYENRGIITENDYTRI